MWEDPPPKRQRGRYHDWVIILKPLMRYPDRWARIDEKPARDLAGATAGNLNRGRVNMPPGRWEFVSRTVVDEGNIPHYYIYGRYLGE